MSVRLFSQGSVPDCLSLRKGPSLQTYCLFLSLVLLSWPTPSPVQGVQITSIPLSLCIWLLAWGCHFKMAPYLQCLRARLFPDPTLALGLSPSSEDHVSLPALPTLSVPDEVWNDTNS